MASWEPLPVSGNNPDPKQKIQDFFTSIVFGQQCILDDMDDLQHLGSNFLVVDADFGSTVRSRLRSSYNDFRAMVDAVRSVFNATRSPGQLTTNRLPPLCVGFAESFGQEVTPGKIRSQHYGKMVSLRGFVSSCSSVSPRLTRCVQYCKATRKYHEQDVASPADTLSSNSGVPIRDRDQFGNDLEMLHGLSQYVDTQTVHIVDSPESLVPGLRPRLVEVTLESDLVERCKVGDRVTVVGFCMPNAIHRQRRRGITQVPMDAVVLANNVITTSVFPQFVYDRDLRNFKALSTSEDCIDVLARSLAPSVYGNLDVKKALLCALVGGREFTSYGGIRRRGEIHILLLGDTATGKSQLLRAAKNAAPVGIIATGKMATPEGLTASVTRPADSMPVLKAGAMVLADKGIVCIDEFDKLTSRTRESISEAMEKGTVTISVPGVQSSLNARCSVLAASNTVYGRYDVTKSTAANIGLDDAALSRFDFMFLMLDRQSEEGGPDNVDLLAKFVLDMHLYREPEKDCSEDRNGINSLPIWEALNPWGAEPRVLSAQFLREYIKHARQISPNLGKSSAQYLAERYAYLREMDAQKKPEDKMFPVTPKVLESLIRVATAFAKCRLARRVGANDAEQAFELMYYACFHKAPGKKTPAELRKAAKEYSEIALASQRLDNPTVFVAKKKKTEKRSKTSPVSVAARPAKVAKVLSSRRFEEALIAIRSFFDEINANDVELEKLTERLVSLAFTSDEVAEVIKRMSDENKLMVAENLVILI